MNKWLSSIVKVGKAVAEITIPGVTAIEAAVEVLKSSASGADKLESVKSAVIGGISAVEFGTDKDLLSDSKVGAAFDGFVASYVTFLNALQEAKSAKVPKPPSA